MKRIQAAVGALIVLLCAQLMAWGASAPTPVCTNSADHNTCITETAPIGVSTSAESGHVITTSSSVLAGFQVNNFSTSTGLTVMVLDATAIPSNGTLAACSGKSNTQTNPCVAKWYGIPAAISSAQPGTLTVLWSPGPNLKLMNGLVLVCSSTGPYTLTLNENCTFSAEAR